MLNTLAENCLNNAKKMHRSDIVHDIKELWRDLTIERDIGVQKYFQRASGRRAYLGYYFPMYVAKVALLLERLKREGHFNALGSEPLRLLDLGSGTLTGVAALSIFFNDRPVKAWAVDKSSAPMRLGMDSLTANLPLDIASHTSTRQASILAPKSTFMPRWKPNFIFLGHVLNELGTGPRNKERKIEFLEDIAQDLEPGGFILIVEPATQVATRDLMRIRDHFARHEEIDILAPCTGAEACPLLKTATSWCFSELKWQRPRAFEQIDRIIGFDREALKLSFLLMTRRASQKSSERRVVSGSMKSEGVLRRYLCTSDGLKTLATPIAGEASSAINAVMRGELLPHALAKKPGVKIVTEK